VASKAIAKEPGSDTDLLKLMPAGSISTKQPKKPKVHEHLCCRLAAFGLIVHSCQRVREVLGGPTDPTFCEFRLWHCG